MRRFLLSAVFFIFCMQAFPQNLTDIVLSENGSFPSFVLGTTGNIYMVYINGQYLYFRGFSAAGAPFGYARAVASCFTGVIQSTTMTGRSGKMLAAWNTSNPMIFQWAIKGGLLSGARDTILAVNQIFSGSSAFQPKITFLNDTLLAAVWTGIGSGAANYGIYGRTFSPNMEMKSDVTAISDITDPKAECGSPVLTARPDGSGFWVFWKDDRSGTPKVYGRAVSKECVPQGSSFLVSEDNLLKSLWFIDAATDKDGNTAVIWGAELGNSVYQVQLRYFDKDGKPLGSSVNVTSREGGVGSDPTVSVAFDSLGNSVAAWDQEEGSKGLRIYAQRYSADRQPVGTPFALSLEKDSVSQFSPILKLMNGAIYCVWTETRPGKISKIKAAILDFSNPILQVSGVRDNKIIKDFSLNQNYPNPFNPVTTIKYSMPSRAFVELKVFDMLGREAATLVSKEQDGGEYEVRFDASKLPSGAYVYTIHAGEFRQSKKLLLMK